jgi:predicted GTPase
MVRKVVILGAAGRDFHNFNVLFRGHADVRVVAFTATQIPQIDGRRYPPELAGPGYPDGIPIVPEQDLEAVIRETGADLAVFSYSDVSHVEVMQLASRALAAGADFQLVAPRRTQLTAAKPVIGVCAVRTGCGKSQTALALVEHLSRRGLRTVAVRHPMPYGDLARQAVQRFAEREDLERHECTIEEREEYEPYLAHGLVIYAGVDYERILRAAEAEADVILWDGGNNDSSFFAPGLLVTILDPLREGHERLYHPGETNLLQADVLVINKVDSAAPLAVKHLHETAARVNPRATIIEARSEVDIPEPGALQGKRVLVVEDGPTLTHGGMQTGAGVVAAQRFGAAEIVDPRPHAVGSIAAAYRKYAQLGPVVPALGYYAEQLADLQQTLAATPCDVVLVASPMSLETMITIDRPVVRVTYRLGDTARDELAATVDRFLA